MSPSEGLILVIICGLIVWLSILSDKLRTIVKYLKDKEDR